MKCSIASVDKCCLSVHESNLNSLRLGNGDCKRVALKEEKPGGHVALKLKTEVILIQARGYDQLLLKAA